MRWRIPRFGIFFMVVLIMMGFGLLMMGENKEGEKPAPESVTE